MNARCPSLAGSNLATGELSFANRFFNQLQSRIGRVALFDFHKKTKFELMGINHSEAQGTLSRFIGVRKKERVLRLVTRTGGENPPLDPRLPALLPNYHMKQ